MMFASTTFNGRAGSLAYVGGFKTIELEPSGSIDVRKLFDALTSGEGGRSPITLRHV
jgi:hypothetical protein